MSNGFKLFILLHWTYKILCTYVCIYNIIHLFGYLYIISIVICYVRIYLCIDSKCFNAPFTLPHLPRCMLLGPWAIK
jgi:hypothetical protein